MKKDLVLVGAADSIGVPYTRDNYEHKGFFEMIEETLSKKYNVISVNCFHMSTNNDNKYIERLTSDNISLRDIKISQNKMLRKCKYSGVYPYIELPKSFLNNYQVRDTDEKFIVKDYLEKENVIFIYSAFVNDLLKASNLSLFKLLRPGRIKRELRRVNINHVLLDVEKNIETLMAINPKMKIYMVGLFVPTKMTYIRNNLREFIDKVNETFSELAKKYDNVYLVNNDNLLEEDFNNIDFHPNKKGHKKIYYNFMKVYNE